MWKPIRSAMRVSRSRVVAGLPPTPAATSLLSQRTAALSTDVNAIPFRVHNFSAGPSCLPLDVLKEAQAEMLSYQDSGMSFMEMSHRDAGGPVQSAITSATQNIRDLLKVPDNYHVLFMHGGAHAQFAGTAVAA